MKRVILSSSQNYIYDFFGPISAEIWRDNIGYRPLVLLTGTPHDWTGKTSELLLGIYYDREIDIAWIGQNEHVSDILQSKLSRYYACALDLPGDDILLTSDLDIWPLDSPWFNQQDESKRCHIFGSNIHSYEMHATCYISATVNTWREINGIFPGKKIHEHLQDAIDLKRTMNPPIWNGWKSDEVFYRETIKSWEGYPKECQMIERDLQEDRIDRSDWPRRIDLEGKYDAHLPRPGTDKKVWKAIRPILEKIIPHRLEYFDNYRQAYLESFAADAM